MHLSCIRLLFCIVLTAAFPPGVRCEQFVLFDRTVTHTGNNMLYDDWDFVQNQTQASTAVRNWLSPVNYADGDIHIRYDIQDINRPCGRFQIGFGFSNSLNDPTKQHCVWWKSATEPGVYEFEDSVKSFWHGPGDSSDPVLPWNFESAFKNYSFFTIIDTPYSSCGADIYPLRMRLTAWIIAKGDNFEPSQTLVEHDASDSTPEQIQIANYPNPFNPSTTITYTLAGKTSRPIRLDIRDIRGALVRRLVSGTSAAGRHSVVWNGLDDNGEPVSSGIYIYSLIYGTYLKSGRMLLVR